ncbi:putative pentatricopeptide repeat-containing protein At5g08310, mitochondrial [Euphorbia lathyris]|uniref:putative pentatricopeptide repeat-containing protein At5g08310, mitochondrial n=1 Tax=Euphorbia lathyris TaxID=212925 RepID=UPI0033138ED4
MLKITKHILCNCNPRSISVKNLSALPPDITRITNDLTSIFSKQPFSPENPKLKNLAPLLNTKVVESVLNSLNNWKIAHIFFTWASTQYVYGYKHNIYTYNVMASILSRARQNASLKALSFDILNSRCSITPGSLGFLIRCLGSVGLVDEANLLFDQAKRMGICVPNSYTYNCLLEAICRSKPTSFGLLEMKLKEMRDQGCEFSKYTLTPVLQAYCNEGKFDEALGIFNEIHSRGWIDAHVFSILVMSFSMWGEVDKAFEFIKMMEDQNIRLNEKTFCNLINGFAKHSRLDKALQLFYMMTNYDIAPDISLYHVLIGGLCTNKQFEKALSLFSEMKTFNIQPDVRIVTKLILAFPEAELARVIDEIHKYTDIDQTLLCNSLLNSLVNTGFIDKAYKLLQAMLGNGCHSNLVYKCDTTSFSIVINGLIQARKLNLALCLFQDMARIDCNRDLLLYNNLIDGLCNSDRLEESYELLREMEESGFDPTQFTLNSIFGCLCRRGNISGAIDMVKKMRVHGHEPWVKHYTLLVNKMCKHGKAMEASIFLADMLKEGFLPDIIAYSALLDGFIEIEEIDQSFKLFQDICARGHRPDVVAYNILIKGLFKSQRIAEAQNLFNEMLRKGLVPSVVTYNLLIDGYCKNGLMNEALLCLSSMSAKEKETEPNVVTYTTLIDGLCKAGRADDAVMLWNEMWRKECFPNRVAFMAFIHGLCKCGRAEAALIHFRDMEEKEMEPDTYTYTSLVSCLVADFKLPLAFEILKKMVDKEKFPNLVDKKYAILKDAILKLLGDARTSSSVKELIRYGGVAGVCISDIESGRERDRDV